MPEIPPQDDLNETTSDDGVTTFKPSDDTLNDDSVTTFQSAKTDDQKTDDQETAFGRASQTTEPRDDAHTTYAARSSVAPAAPARISYRPGAMALNGKYELLEDLKGGAQALAFRGRRVLDDKTVFIKIQANEVNGATLFAKQIAVREKMLALTHPNLLKCHDWDLDRESLCEVYDFIPGTELAEWIMTVDRPLSDVLVENFVRQIAEAIHALHEKTSLAHRDLKPSNIMVLTQNGELHFKVVDYGTVSHLDSGGTTTIAGTRDYSPPECYRRSVNNAELRSWDWWSFGRILQTVLGGMHPYDRYLSGQGNAAFRETFVDSIMLEDDIKKHRMRAGMVEMFEKEPQSARWLPLLRGLLASNKQSRWGYDHIRKFLQGETVRDAYAQPVGVDAYLYEGSYWDVAKLAKKWIDDSAKEESREEGGAKENNTWEKARKQVYGGGLLQYIEKTMQDELLLRHFLECRRVANLDLGTGLALRLLAKQADSVEPEQTETVAPEEIAPAVRGKVIDRAYVVVVAQEATQAAETLVTELMSPEFRRIMEQVAPQSTASLIELSHALEELKGRAEQFQPDVSKRVTWKTGRLVRLLAASDDEVAQAITTGAKQRYHHTALPKLQTLYGATDLQKLPPLDLKTLSLALDDPGPYGFVTNKYEAERLGQEAKRYQQADAHWQMSNYFSWKWALFSGKPGAMFRLWSVLAFLILFGNALRYAVSTGRLFEFNYPLLLLGATMFAGIFISLRFWLSLWLRGDLARSASGEALLLPLAPEQATNPTALNARAKELAPNSGAEPKHFREMLEERNAQIRQIPGVETILYVEKAVSFKKAYFIVALQATLIVLLLVCGSIYAPWLGHLTAPVTLPLLAPPH